MLAINITFSVQIGLQLGKRTAYLPRHLEQCTESSLRINLGKRGGELDGKRMLALTWSDENLEQLKP